METKNVLSSLGSELFRLVLNVSHPVKSKKDHICHSCTTDSHIRTLSWFYLSSLIGTFSLVRSVKCNHVRINRDLRLENVNQLCSDTLTLIGQSF